MPEKTGLFRKLHWLSSLKNQVQLGAVLIGAASLVIVGTIIIFISFNFQRTRISQGLNDINQMSIVQIESYFNNLMQEVDHLGRIPGLTEMAGENQQQILQGLIRLNKAYEVVALLDRRGQLLTSVTNSAGLNDVNELNDLHGMDFSQTHAFIYAFKRRELYISSINTEQCSAGQPQETIVVAAPIRNKKDEVDGVMYVKINLKFFKALVCRMKIGKSGQAFVLDGRNIIIAGSNHLNAQRKTVPALADRLSGYPVLKLLHPSEGKKGEPAVRYKNVFNVNVLGNVDFIRPFYWKMVIELPVDEAYALTLRMIFVLVISLGLISVFTIFISFQFVNRKIITPLEKMISVSQGIIDGLLDTKVTIDSPPEFKLLAATFNTMLLTLSSRIGFENLIINISNRFINFYPARAEGLITQSLQEINDFFDTDFVFFHYFQEEGNHKKYYGAGKGHNPLSRDDSFCQDCLSCDWYREQVKQSAPVAVTPGTGLPAAADALWRLVTEQHILALLHIPVTTAEQTSGILGMHTLVREKNWEKHDLVLLKVLTEIFLNVFEQQKIKHELIESEMKYKELTDTLPHIIFEIDVTGKLTYANQFALQLFGYSEPELQQGIHLRDFFTPEAWENMAEIFRSILTGAKPLETECLCKKKNGALFPVLMYSLPINEHKTITGMRGIMLDLTERKKTEEELLKIQKLESIGILSGGIAHDFNNILSSIIGNISLAKYSLSGQADKELEEILNDAQRAGLQARELTHQLLTFSKGGSPIKKLGSISQVVLETARFCLRGSNLEFELKAAPELWDIEFDEGQICQVINNLLINAKQAMPDGGKISIAIENVTERLPAHFLPQPGRYIKITVRDTGPGIPEAIIDKIFDPYFTTKQSGSGLGLTTVYSIIKQHHGFIDVKSTVKQGACFTLYLPVAGDKVKKNQPPAANQYPLHYHKKILVMDDDLTIRKTMKSILNALGYEADTVPDGAAAIQQYKQACTDNAPYDAVILDLTVQKGMGGKETIGLLRQWDDKVKAVVSSGYSNDPVMAAYHTYGFDAVLTKPYTLEDIGKVLANLFKS